jgi:hypothetical protein
MNFLLQVLRATLAAFVMATSAQADSITFIHQGSGSGTLNGQSFGALAPVSFTITAIADTGSIEFPGPGVLSLEHSVASITIAGVGTFDFVTATRTFFNDDNDLVGFGRSVSLGGTDLFYSGQGATLDGYDLASSIGPVAGSGLLQQWNLGDVLTSGGVLFFAGSDLGGTFTARTGDTTPVPLPSALALSVLALGLMTVRRKRA